MQTDNFPLPSSEICVGISTHWTFSVHEKVENARIDSYLIVYAVTNTRTTHNVLYSHVAMFPLLLNAGQPWL